MEDGARLLQRLTPFLRENAFVILLGCTGLLFLGYGLIDFLASNTSSEEIVISEGEERENVTSFITVDVSGAVNRPGVYTLPSDSRINEAVSKAGGLSDEADHLTAARTINFAKLLTDGEKIYIPMMSEGAETSVLAADTGKTSINNASSSQLEALPGIGPVTAEKIVKGRPYSSLDELTSKKVVGQSVYEKIKDVISL